MGIKLDWEIEAEQAVVQNAGEDKETQRLRRQARARFLLFLLIVLLFFGGIAAAIALRLRAVDMQFEQLLRDTVDAEITALRIGDREAYMAIQRSATEDWLIRQEQLFDQYQGLKATQDVRLTGQITDLEIDGKRARVRVEEIINGVPYTRVWFYWNYAEGWKHVPSDYTFWGEPATLDGAGVAVRYRTVDDAFARDLASRISDWYEQGCAILACPNLPEITIEIVPDEWLRPGWAAANPWMMQVASPSVGRARLDQPFDLDQQRPVARLLAERLVAQATDNIQPLPTADAAFLREAAIDWLAGRFTQTQTEAVLMQSLTQRYGNEALRRLLPALQPNSDISVLNQVAGTTSLEQVEVDWRGFLEWRLRLEQQLNFNRDEANFLNLYDTGDPSAFTIGQGRYNASMTPEAITVVSAAPEIDANGVPHLRARVQIGSDVDLREEEVIFRLVNGVWRRAN